MAPHRGGREPRSPQWSRRKMLALLAMAALTVAALVAGLVLAVVHAANPVYTQWQTQALPLAQRAIDTARRLRAVLMFPGNVYNFGAPFYGSLAGHNPPSPVVGLGAYRGTGYYLATSGGNVYTFGQAPFDGSPASEGITLSAPVSGIALVTAGWLAPVTA